jgi:hypothetical protein
MPFYLLQENGDKILLEDLTGFVILETVLAPTVFYQAGGGAGHPAKNRRRRRHETQLLFERMERTLQEALGLVAPVVAEPESGAPTPVESPWTPARLEASLAELAVLAAGSAHFEARWAALQRQLDASIEDRRRRDEDDEFWLLLS